MLLILCIKYWGDLFQLSKKNLENADTHIQNNEIGNNWFTKDRA